VLLEFYGEDSYFFGKRVSSHGHEIFKAIQVTKDKRNEIITYFYPTEISKLVNFQIGSRFYYEKPRFSFDIKLPHKFWVKDMVKEITFGFMHGKIEIRIVGKYHMEIDKCMTEKDFLLIPLNKGDKILNFQEIVLNGSEIF
jgi:hypothetical protein